MCTFVHHTAWIDASRRPLPCLRQLAAHHHPLAACSPVIALASLATSRMILCPQAVMEVINSFNAAGAVEVEVAEEGREGEEEEEEEGEGEGGAEKEGQEGAGADGSGPSGA